MRCRLALALLWILSALLSIPVVLIAVQQTNKQTNKNPILDTPYSIVQDKAIMNMFKDVYSIVYTDPTHTQSVEVWQVEKYATNIYVAFICNHQSYSIQ